MEQTLAPGSQTFEQDLFRLYRAGAISLDEALTNADSPTNLIWRLHNDMTPVSKAAAPKEEFDGATFTDITLDVLPAESRAVPLGPR